MHFLDQCTSPLLEQTDRKAWRVHKSFCMIARCIGHARGITVPFFCVWIMDCPRTKAKTNRKKTKKETFFIVPELVKY
jgi:hypothetical protein